MDLKTFWISVLNELSQDLKRADIITWFKNTAALNTTNGILEVGLPLPVFLNWHAIQFKVKTLAAAQKIDPSIQEIKYIVDLTLNENDPRVIPVLKQFPEKSARKLPQKAEVKLSGDMISRLLNPRYSLDRFIVSPENRLAHAACQTVATQPGQNYNPLFIYGGVGLGKTHLLQGTGLEILRRDPSKVVVYTTTESFANEVIEAIQSRNMHKLRNKYRRADVLIIDDIQFIANKDRTQEEFFHTFNALFDAGKQIIISADRPPHELTLLSERLVSRFESGMTVEVRMPDYETRLAILQSRCQDNQVFLSAPVLERIAQDIPPSIRALEGTLNRVIAQYELECVTPTIKSVEPLLTRGDSKISEPVQDVQNTIESLNVYDLIELTAKYFNISKDDLLGAARTRDVMLPRQILMFLAKTKLRMSLSKIGEIFGNRNHSTVLHAVEKVAEQLKSDRQLMRDLNALAREAGIA